MNLPRFSFSKKEKKSFLNTEKYRSEKNVFLCFRAASVSQDVFSISYRFYVFVILFFRGSNDAD